MNTMADPLTHDAPRWWRVSLSGALASYAFFSSFSPAGVYFALVALVALTLARPRALLDARPWREPVMLAGLLLLAWIALHTVFTTDTVGLWRGTVNRYHELLFAPLLFALLRDAGQRRLYLRALLAGTVLLALSYWTLGFTEEWRQHFLDHRISAGFALATGAFLALALSQAAVHRWGCVALAAFLAATVVFAINGRTGHLVVLVLAAYAAWLHAPRRWRWAAVLAAPLLLVGLALLSPGFQERAAETFHSQSVVPVNGDPSSTEIRRELGLLSLDMARKYWATGSGFAHFRAVRDEAAEARYAKDPLRAHYLRFQSLKVGNPHNEYAMQIIGGGIVSLALFLAWLLAALRTGAASAAPTGPMLVAATIAFAIGCAFNSMLMDFIEGHFYMGLLACLAAACRWPAPAPREERVQRILVVTTRQIGDVLLTSPLVRAARRRWPGATVDVLGFERTLGMLAGNPDVDTLVEVPARLGFARGCALALRLWRRYDLALVADAGDRAFALGWIAAPRRAAILPERSGSNWWKRPWLEHVVTASGDRGSVHSVVEKHALLAPWLDGQEAPPVTVPPPAPLPPAFDAIVSAGCVVVHAPSMWEYKQWPLEHYATVVRALLAEGRQVVLTGSGSARDQECIAPLRRLGASPQLVDTSGALDFKQLATLFGRAALYIGPDTSVSHLAAAAGVRVIAVLGPTNPQRWAPWPAGGHPVHFVQRADMQRVGNVTVLQGPQPCVPCGRAGCEDHRASGSECLPAIRPERVLQEAAQALGGFRTGALPGAAVALHA